MAYTPSGKPLDGARGIASVIRDEFELVSQGAADSFHNPVFTGLTTIDTGVSSNPPPGSSGTQIATMSAVTDAIAAASLLNAPVIIPFVALYNR